MVQPSTSPAAPPDVARQGGGGNAYAYFGFLVLPGFSMIAFASAIEVLRMANYISQQPLYRWSVITFDGASVEASNGLPIAPVVTLEEAGRPDVLFVCGGVNVHDHVDEALVKRLTQLSRVGVALGGLCTGSYALVKAGLVNGYRCVIHWENVSALREEFAKVAFVEDLFVIDRDRLTCSGGTAPIDLMLDLIAQRVGPRLAAEISAQFIVERIRASTEKQPVSVVARMGFSRKELVVAAQLMEAHIDEPLPFEDIACQVGLSQRQLQRMFKHYLDISPTRYYLWLRLQRARELLLQTHISIMNVTVACGFQSPCHFSKTYRTQFGHSPSDERRMHQGQPLAGRSPPQPPEGPAQRAPVGSG